MFDPSPNPAPFPPPPDAVPAPPLPTPSAQVWRAVREGAASVASQARYVVDLLRDPPRARAELQQILDALGEMLTLALAPVPSTPFNGHVSTLRLEGIGRTFPGVTRTSLGSICNQVDTWPHDKMKEAIQNLYMFASDYPGIRHAGTPANARRAIEMRDLVSMSIPA